jgi:ubiquinone/menaquinone biosynthesis C-methylase UbiE
MDKDYAQYLLKKTTQDYNLIADDFSRAREHIWEEMRFLFDDFLIPGERVLDLGCGNGRFYQVMKDKNIDYTGVDISEKLIEIAKKRFPKAKFQVTDALNLPFPDNYFDKVYSVAVLQHIPSQEFRLQFLKEAKRVLRPKGILILTVWNLWRKAHIKRMAKNAVLKIIGKSKLDFKDFFLTSAKHSLFKGFYYHCFTPKELEKLVKKAGFKIKKSELIVMSTGRKPHSNYYIVAEK